MYFFNPKEQACKDFKETYVSISEKLYGMIKVGAIDCLKEEELCEEFSAFDIPQILIFTEATNDDGERYRGEMTAEKIINAAAKKMQSFVSSVNEANYDNFVDRERMSKNKILLFSDKKSTPTIFKALSKKHVDRLNFGEVKQAEASLLKQFGVTVFPTIIALTEPEDYKGEKYEGEMTVDQLSKWVSTYAYSSPKKIEVTDFQELTEKKVKNGMLCGPKSSNICVIVFTDDAREEQLNPLK